MLTTNCLFGYDGAIFHKLLNTIIVEKGTVLAVVSENDVVDNIKSFSKFCTFISIIKYIRIRLLIICHILENLFLIQ
jgi:hypothetical protein